jgi:hypothetical protein
VQTDDKGNAYLLVVPVLRPTDAPRDVPRLRDVLRISGDGKKRSTLSPMKSSKFANATTVTTRAIALDPEGALSMLTWARWPDSSSGEEKNGQYIVSFDKDGEYRSEAEVDWRELGVTQFEAFGSGRFLLRGRRVTNADEMRLAVFSANGQTLVDVVDWSDSSGAPEPKEHPARRRMASFDQMVRGGDGRIYVTQPAELPDENVVYAINTSGETEKVCTLPRLLGGPSFVGLKAAADRLAAVYVEGGSGTERFWIAIYDSVAANSGGTSPLAVYGPAPGVPISYQHEESGDRFTFLKEGHFVTMSSP